MTEHMRIHIWNSQRWRLCGNVMDLEVVYWWAPPFWVEFTAHISAVASSSLNRKVITIVMFWPVRSKQNDIPANAWHTRLCAKDYSFPTCFFASLVGMSLFTRYSPVAAMINRQTVPDLGDNFYVILNVDQSAAEKRMCVNVFHMLCTLHIESRRRWIWKLLLIYLWIFY